MEEDFRFIELFDIYKGLLTEKQRDMFYSHYFLDLSLSEVAETNNMQRQSVFDAIKKVKEKLNEYEDLLKIKETNDKLVKLSGSVDDKTSKKIKQIIGK